MGEIRLSESLHDFDRRLLSWQPSNAQPSRFFSQEDVQAPYTTEPLDRPLEPTTSCFVRSSSPAPTPHPTLAGLHHLVPKHDYQPPSSGLDFGTRRARSGRISIPHSHSPFPLSPKTRLQDPFETPPLPMRQTSNAFYVDGSPTPDCHQRRQAPGDSQVASYKPKARLSSGYQQIQLDHAPPIANGIHLISPRLALPDKVKELFPYEVFNAVQSKCFATCYGSSENLVVSAPTGSGKTTILELAICKLIADKGHQSFKIVTDMSRVRNATIIVTTPEKWDSLTRKWEDHHRLLQLVRLFLIDEVHILRDSRGATLEAIVSRMKTIGVDVRFIALSATIPNSEDIASWLGRDHKNQQVSAWRETFGEEMRPVKLDKVVYGTDASITNPFAFDKVLNSKLRQVVQKYAEGKPIMVFCFTRKSCEATALVLANMWMSLRMEDKIWPTPTKKIHVEDSKLAEITRAGVAFHHAGLGHHDRQAAENGFLSGQISAICCTSTLAVGVNLPCHTVILKGTVGFSDGKTAQEYSDIEVMQMLGRAGRPQFDTSARGIVLTTRNNEQRYQRMLSGQEVLESTLHRSLICHLNSEIVLRTINDVASAKVWLKGTFLYVRLQQNPSYYRISPSADVRTVDAKIEELCEREIYKLQEAGLVSKGVSFHSTEYGRAMAKFMVEFETMKSLLEIPRAVNIELLLKSLCRGTEFYELRYRKAERSALKTLNKAGTVLFPVKDNLVEPWTKAFLLAQVALGGVEPPNDQDYVASKKQMLAETNIVFERLRRLLRCFIDCKASDLDAIGIRSAMELFRSLMSKCWDGRPTEILQVPNIGPVASRKLASHGIGSIRQLAIRSPSDIERILSRNPPMGTKLLSSLKKFPVLTLHGVVADRKSPSRAAGLSPSVTIQVMIGYSNKQGQPSWPWGKVPSLTFVAETTDGTLRFFWRDSIRRVDGLSGLEFTFPVMVEKFGDEILLSLACEEVAGTEVSQRLEHGVPEHQFQPKKDIIPRTETQIDMGRPLQDEFSDPDLSDQDFLGLLDCESWPAVASSRTPTHSQVSGSEFTPIDELAHGNCNKERKRATSRGHGSADLEKPLEEPRRLKRNARLQTRKRQSGLKFSPLEFDGVDYVDLSTMNDTEQCVERQTKHRNDGGRSIVNAKTNRLFPNYDACHEIPGLAGDGPSQRPLSTASSHYGSDIFSDEDLPDLDELVRRSQVKQLGKKTSNNPQDEEMIVSFAEWSDGERGAASESGKGRPLAAHEQSTTKPARGNDERVPRELDGVENDTKWTNEPYISAEEENPRTLPEGGNTIYGDEPESFQEDPSWLHEIDPWVVSLVKGSVEFLE
ncbi:putative ATP-dependent DNA helicase [Zalerion maritima]|uniref:DNA 3'-5' helicase n=1 Tax=Zalerion maritima TaxID=339359 RepID=A0AAD5RFD1_9PEZI|nr:putative ATP-dependent DNA helicase [Zalerion maritima]